MNGRYTVIVGSSGGKMNVNSGKWPWCLWEKSSGKLCCSILSGVRGDLSLVVNGHALCPCIIELFLHRVIKPLSSIVLHTVSLFH